MARRTVLIPAGFAPTGVGSSLVRVRIDLVSGDSLAPVIGVDSSLGQLTAPSMEISVNGESAEIELSVNADITPSDTVWRVGLSADGRVMPFYYCELAAGETAISLSDFLGW